MSRTINDAFAVLAEGDMEEQLLALQQYVNALPTVAFKTVTDGTNSAVAAQKDDTLTVEGTNDVTVSVDATTKKVTISGLTLKTAIAALSTSIAALPTGAFKTLSAGSTNLTAGKDDALTLRGQGGASVVLDTSGTTKRVTVQPSDANTLYGGGNVFAVWPENVPTFTNSICSEYANGSNPEDYPFQYVELTNAASVVVDFSKAYYSRYEFIINCQSDYADLGIGLANYGITLLQGNVTLKSGKFYKLVAFRTQTATRLDLAYVEQLSV